MTTFAEQRRILTARFKDLQAQLAQAQNTVELTKTELAKVIGKFELIAELEKDQARFDGQQPVPTDVEVAS